MNRLAAFAERHVRASLAALLLALLALAWSNRFIQDDAFIAFRYADHLVRGEGLVFNPGERVEGYTCFLWVVLIAAGMRAGLDPVTASRIIGLLACAGSLIGTHALVRALSGSRLVALVTVLVLGTNYTFSAYATGGLETQLQTCLVTAVLALGATELLGDRARPARLLVASALAALAILTRPDSLLLLTPMGLALAARVLTGQGTGRARLLSLALLIVPCALVVGAWIMWKIGYYGAVLPNTFHAKVAAAASLPRGLFYLYQFVSSYWLAAGVALAVWMWRDLLAVGGRAARVMLVTLAAWLAYVAAIGGDFMEFRLLVPVLPLVSWALVRTAQLLDLRARLGSALIALALAGSLQHAIVYNRVRHPYGNESVRELMDNLYGPRTNWVGLGRALRRDLGADSTVVIATTAAGAIPYYSGLRAVDMLGLADPWIARHGIPYTEVPGHRRVASLDYLVRRRVTLIIGHPTPAFPRPGPLCVQDFDLPQWEDGTSDGRGFPPDLRAVEIAVGSGPRMLAYYLTPNARVDEAIRSRGWRVRDVADCAER